jgi:putative peptidoglycan binding protein
MSMRKIPTKIRKLQSEQGLSPRRKTRPVKAAAGFRKAAKRAPIEEDLRLQRSAMTGLEPEQPEEIGETLPPETTLVPKVVKFEPPEVQDDDTPPEEFEEEAEPRAGARAARARGVLAAARRRTPAQVVAWAKRQHDNGSSGWAGMCLKFARTAAGAPGGTRNAKAAWSKARFRHKRGTPPAGSFVFWGGGTHGHVAVSIGGGHIWSTDIRRRGRVDRVTISFLTSRWNMPYLGWTEDVNGVRILGLKAPPSKSPIVSLANLKPGKRNADVKTLQLALRSKGYTRLNPSGLFDPATRTMVRAFQKAQGWSGSDADGVPGPKTCARLGLALR